VAIAALSLLAMTAGTAAALRSLTSSQREIVLLSREFTLHGFATVICEVSLNTTLNSLSSSKRENAIVGRLTMVILRCQNGAAVVALNTPWNVKYKSIEGTLPNITAMRLEIERMQFRITGNLSCLLTFEMTGTQEVRNGTVGTLLGRPFSLRERSIREFCNNRETFEGEFAPMGGPITVRLA